jgi:hypothetical protein
MSYEEFLAYAADEIGKACAKPGEEVPEEEWRKRSKARTSKLCEAFAVAKQFFAEGETMVPPKVGIEVYVDEWKQAPTEQEIKPGQQPTAKTETPEPAATPAPAPSPASEIAKRASDAEESVTEVAWPSDMNTEEFRTGKGDVRKGAWGSDGERP